VVGTVTIAAKDHELREADAEVRVLFRRRLRGPFDALICAAARSLDLALIFRDGEIEEWGRVPTLW
jgi:hypothetical protein